MRIPISFLRRYLVLDCFIFKCPLLKSACCNSFQSIYIMCCCSLITGKHSAGRSSARHSLQIFLEWILESRSCSWSRFFCDAEFQALSELISRPEFTGPVTLLCGGISQCFCSLFSQIFPCGSCDASLLCLGSAAASSSPLFQDANKTTAGEAADAIASAALLGTFSCAQGG